MHARQSVTSTRDTEPAGNSEKSRTSRGCFALDDFAAFTLFDATAFFVDFDATAFFAASFFDEDFFDDFLTAAFFAFGGAGLAFFAAVFRVLLVAAIQSAPMETRAGVVSSSAWPRAESSSASTLPVAARRLLKSKSVGSKRCDGT